MPIEETAIKTTKDVVEKSAYLAENLVRKAWSILDAAAEKKTPSEVVSKDAISAIQGKK